MADRAVTEAELRAELARVFPVTGSQVGVALVATEVRDGVLCATLQTITREDDGSIRDLKEQELYLLPQRHWTARGVAFVKAAAACAARIPFERFELLMPHDLFPSPLLDIPGLDDFVAALDDPRTLHAVDICPDNIEVLATCAPGRPVPPMLANAELEAGLADDPEPWAVYSDWLTERGDPRGELIAVQLALEERPGDDALRARALQLLREYAFEWLGRFAWAPPHEVVATWRRGFVETIRFGADDRQPEQLSNVGCDSEIRQLARLPGMQFLRKVELLCHEFWDEEALAAIGEVGLPPRTTEVSIKTAEYQALGGLEPAYPGLANVRVLSLDSNAMELGAIALPALRQLALVTRGLTRNNLASLHDADWPVLERLELWLGDAGVHDCDVELADLAWILDGERLPALRELGLCGRDARELLERFADAAILPRLRVLDLAGSGYRREDAAWLQANAARFAHLERLVLPRPRLPAERDTPPPAGLNIIVDDRFIPVYE